jgi:hypothetical protein
VPLALDAGRQRLQPADRAAHALNRDRDRHQCSVPLGNTQGLPAQQARKPDRLTRRTPCPA